MLDSAEVVIRQEPDLVVEDGKGTDRASPEGLGTVYESRQGNNCPFEATTVKTGRDLQDDHTSAKDTRDLATADRASPS